MVFDPLLPSFASEGLGKDPGTDDPLAVHGTDHGVRRAFVTADIQRMHATKRPSVCANHVRAEACLVEPDHPSIVVHKQYTHQKSIDFSVNYLFRLEGSGVTKRLF